MRKKHEKKFGQIPKPINEINLALFSILIGIFGGFGAVIFRDLIGFFHNLLFLRQISIAYDANVHTPSSYLGVFVILVPVIGAAGVAFLVKNFAPEAKGHGVPEVIDAIFYRQGKIRPIVAVVKSVASALSIGSGGSIGREGPIIQIGSSIGSTLGQIMNLPAWQRITLVASGAGAGIAATFNTPVGGVLFALEIITHEVSVRTIVPIALATVSGTYIGRLFYGDHPSFVIPGFETPYFQITQPQVLISYIGLGILAGLVSALFIRSIYWMEDFFDKHIKGSYYIRHMAGMLLVGVMIYLLITYTGHYYVEGVGYSTVQDILTSILTNPYLLLTLLVLKLLATSLTLGSGASGGIFSPGLFLGATLGGLYGIILHSIFPGLLISPPAFAVVGMAAIVGGTTGAAMTAIVMIFEMTLDYNVLLPLTLGVAVSFEVRKLLSAESIYTLKLVRRGHYIPSAFRRNFQDFLRADQIMGTPVCIIPSTTMLSAVAAMEKANDRQPYFVVTDEKGILGTIENDIPVDPASISQTDKPVSEFINTPVLNTSFIIVEKNMPYLEVLRSMYNSQTNRALVVDRIENNQPGKIIGVITEKAITNLVQDNVALF